MIVNRWVTGGSLPVTTGPNLADHAQTRNVRDANKNGHKRTDRNLHENDARLCKTFIHRFDSDRRLQTSQQLWGDRQNVLHLPLREVVDVYQPLLEAAALGRWQLFRGAFAGRN